MKNWKRSYWILILLILTNIVQAEPNKNIKRQITLSLGYDEAFNSNEGMKHLPLTTMQAYSWVFDQVSKMTTDKWSRGALIAADFILHMPYLGQEFNDEESNWFFKEKWWPYLPAFHEFGHARAIRAFSNGKFNEYNIQIHGSPPLQAKSVLWYYLYSLKHAALVRNTSAGYDPLVLRDRTQELMVTAGGLNNESRLAKEITDLIYRFNGHIGYFGTYLRTKLGSVSYTAKTISGVVANNVGDVNHIVTYYKHYDRSFDIYNIQYGGWIGLLLSSSTYSFLKGYWDFITTGDPTVRTFTWNGIRLPDVNFYFTRNGLSLEAVTGYQVNPNLGFNLGIETVYYPKVTAMEITPSIRYVLPTRLYGTFELDIGIVLNTHMHLAGHVGVEWTDPINPFTFNAKVIFHNANTYVGERNITYSRVTDYETEFMLSASFNY
jgi:hypothetical protein